MINIPMMRSRILKCLKNILLRKIQISRTILMISNQWMAIALRYLYVLPELLISYLTFCLYVTVYLLFIWLEWNRAKTIPDLTVELGILCLSNLVHPFLHTKIHSNDDQPCGICPFYTDKISVFNSVSSTFYASSDLCSTRGMHREYI